ncbi:MAG: hypothetical protein J3Q66DRAFT_351774 [Benniella sp.]|nr:MAG: hypothetical protein J3Q66DRAFT_351774 [Benniella sp.]
MSTPTRLHLQEQAKSPLWRLTLHKFFHDTPLSDWLAEVFAEQMGGDDLTVFLNGIALASRKCWGLSSHFKALSKYYASEAGRAQLTLLERQHITKRKMGTAGQRLLGDYFDEITHQPSSSSSDPRPLPSKKRPAPLQDASSSSSGPRPLPSNKRPAPSPGASSSSVHTPHRPPAPKQSSSVSSGNLHHFFQECPTTQWLDYRAFSRYVLSHDPLANHISSYKDYIKNLQYISKYAGWIRKALDGMNIRESGFKTEFLSVQGEMMRKRRRIDDAEDDGKQYNALWDDAPLPCTSSDQDFLEGSQAGSEDANDEDITGEIPLPQGTDQFVGPGTFSSQLYCDFTDHIQVDGQDVNDLVMTHRRTHVIQTQATTLDEQLLANFLITKALLVSVLPPEISATAVNEVFPRMEPKRVSLKDQEFLTDLCAQACSCDYDALQLWFQDQKLSNASIVFRAVTNFFSETCLWAPTNWYRPNGDNEDTFIDALLKPVLSAAFGTLVGSTFRWTRDPLKTNKVMMDSLQEYPDYQVSLDNHAYILGEFKTPTASPEDMERDWKKLVVMGKKAVDNLFKAGVNVPVVLLHGQGLKVSVHTIALYSEAFYKVSDLGIFKLVSSPHEFGMLLSIGSLYSAQVIKETDGNGYCLNRTETNFTFPYNILGHRDQLVQHHQERSQSDHRREMATGHI